MTVSFRALVPALLALLPAGLAPAASAQEATAWKTSWAASVQGPYPVGNPSAQPDQRAALPDPARGARDQSFRLVLRPSLWGRQARLRFSNAFGTKPVTLDGVHVGLQLGSAALVPGTNRPVRFGGGWQGWTTARGGTGKRVYEGTR